MRSRTLLLSILVSTPILLAFDAREYILLVDRHPLGTGLIQEIVGGVWTTITLSDIDWDDTEVVSLSSNRFGLPPGTYEVRARVPLDSPSVHRLRLQSTFPVDATLVMGTTNRGGSGSSGGSEVVGKFQISVATNVELQVLC